MDDGVVFRALADDTRRRLLDLLYESHGLTLQALCEVADMSRQAISKHLAVLEAANLVSTRRVGRTKLHHLNQAPIQDIHERWIAKYNRVRITALSGLKAALEDEMSTFTYVTYIRTSRERLWEALTSAEFTRQYWNGREIDSEWTPGAPVVNRHDYDDGAENMGTVLVYDPPRRLSYGRPGAAVTFELTPHEDVVMLQVVQEGLDDATWRPVTGGWQFVMANLKTLLESGAPLPMPQQVLSAYR